MAEQQTLSVVPTTAETQPIKASNSFYAMREWKKADQAKDKEDDKKDTKPVKTFQTFFALHNPKATKKTAPQYILTYFTGRGRAEVSRLLLSEAEIPFEDYRIIHDDEHWLPKKENYPFCQLPTLEKLGSSLKVSESSAIERYIAKIGGLMGENEDEAARIDMFYEVLKSFITGFLTILWMKDSDDKKAKLKVLFDDEWPKSNTLLTKEFKSDPFKPSISPFSVDKIYSDPASPIFLVGRKISLADILFYRGYSEVIASNPEALKDFPELSSLYERIRDRPNIAKWVKERPQTTW
jgi:glutathione S-transferase